MSRTKYGLKAKATYSLPKVKMIIEDQCQKKKLVCPNLEKGLLNKKAREYGLRPFWNNGCSGHGYREKYLGESVIIFVDMFILDLKGEKKKTKIVQSWKKAAAPNTVLTPLEELANESEESADTPAPVNPYEELFTLLNNCITEMEAIRDKLEDFIIFGGAPDVS